VDYAINIVHGMLLLKPFYEGIRYTLLDDIKETEADITFAGHYHSGFGVRKINSKYFINPGSIVRISSSLTELERKPEVVYLEFNENGIHIEEIELKTARPGDEVLDREKLEAAKDRNLKLHQFYQELRHREGTKNRYSQIVEEIASSDELSREVKEEALRRIGIARENLAKGQDEE